MLRRIHDPDRGASMLEYAAVLVLVGAIAATLFGSGLAGMISSALTTAVDSALSPSEGAPGSGSGSDGPEPQAGEPSPQTPARDVPDPGAEPAYNDDPDTGLSIGTGFYDPEDGEASNDPGLMIDAADNAQPVGFLDHVTGFGETVGGLAADQWDQTTQDAADEWDEAASDFGGYLDGKLDSAADTYTALNDDLNDRLSPAKELFEQRWENGDGAAAVGGWFVDYWRIGLWEADVSPGNMLRSTLDDIFNDDYDQAVEDGREGDALAHALWNAGGMALPFKWPRFLGDLPGTGTGRPDGDGGSVQADGEEPGAQNPGGGNSADEDDNENSSPSCATNSFLPHTPVLMADGSHTAIEDIAVGDEVHAMDPRTGAEGSRTVTHLITGAGEKILVEVTVTDPTGETGSVTATDGHPFWAPELAEWIDAVDLEPGTWLRTAAGTWTQVTAVDIRKAQNQRVHNLTIDGLHTYYVAAGRADVLTHNQSGRRDCGDDQAQDLGVSLNKLRDRQLKMILAEKYDTDPHEFKEDYVGRGSVSRFDVAKGDDGHLWLVSKDGKITIRTNETWG